VATVFLLLASLVAAAGFAVVAQRRLRQLGMLAAVGATGKHLRLVMLTNGAVIGTLAAAIGTTAGLGLWLVFAPTLESAVDHRIDRLSLPWVLIAMAGLVAIAGATAAAWWPGRTVARLPVLLALSGRPPKPRPARHSAIAAAALIAAGIGCLALSALPPAPAPPPKAAPPPPLGYRCSSADRGRHRLPRAVRPRQPAADHRRALGNDSRQPAPWAAGDPYGLRGGRAGLDRAAIGATGPGPLPGSVRSRARRSHALARHRS